MTELIPTSVDAPVLHHGDCLAFMRTMPAASVHLIFVDPPYFKVKAEAWDRQWDKPAGFLAWIGELADEWRRILAPNGSLYCCASPRMQARVECVIAERFEILNSIVWAKPPFSTKAEMFDKSTCRGFFPVTERIIFAEQRGADSMAMGESGYEAQCEKLRGFVFEPLRAYIVGEFKRAGMLTTEGKIAANVACGFSASAGGMAARHYFSASQWWLPTAEHYTKLKALLGEGFLLREHVELRAECDALQAKYETLRAEYETLRRPFAVSADVPYTDVWTFPTVAHYPGKHPCEKPAALLDHVITASSRPGDVVFDGFMGSGATGERAALLGRRFVGCELGDYFHGAQQRVLAATRGQSFAPPKRGKSKRAAIVG